MLVREPPFPRGGTRGRGVGGLGALIRTANQFQNSDFPTPRGYEQAVHPPFKDRRGVLLSLSSSNQKRLKLFKNFQGCNSVFTL